MALQDFELGEDLLATYRFESTFLSEADEGSLVGIEELAGTKKVMVLFKEGRRVTCEPYDDRARSVAIKLRQAGLGMLVSVLTVGQGKVVLQGRTFASSMTFPADKPLEILVTERVVDELPTSARTDPMAFLSDQFLLSDCAFALSSSKITGSDFTLVGPNYRLAVALRNGIPRAVRISRRRKGWIPAAPLRLLRGAIHFKDATLSAALKTINAEDLSQRTGAGEYLSSWETYNELEAHHLRLRLNDFGFVRYTSWTRVRKDNKTALRFDFADPLPDGLRRESIDVEASPVRPAVDPDTGNIQLPEDLMVVGEMLPSGDTAKQALVIPVEDSEWVRPPSSGYLLPSVRGNKVQLGRRDKALRRVLEGDAPLPTLEALLESGDAPTADVAKRDPKSKRSLAALHGVPTPVQFEALDVALNTPDIALIQGPPGTGKTSVIRALVTRWTELLDRSTLSNEESGNKPRVLVASAQHDAVDNAVEGVDIDGLPAFRMGGRRSGGQENRVRALSEWVKERRAVCEKKLQGFGTSPNRQLSRDVDRLIAQWRQVRGVDDQDLLRQVLELARPHLSTELLNSLSRAIVAQASSTSTTAVQGDDGSATDRLEKRLLTLTAAQRVTPEEFAEDGLFQAKRLLEFLEVHGESLRIRVPASLRDAAQQRDDPHESAGLVAEALAEIKPGEADSGGISTSADATELIDTTLEQVSTAVQDAVSIGKHGVAEALAAYTEELQDLDSVGTMIEKYAGVVAATCQQSVMQDYKLVDFDLVIVDEAARVSPMDLLIPMSHGKKIVLVGDHKQLPHMLEPEVKDSFIKSGRGNKQFVEESLFQRLFDKFTAVHKAGGPKRVVTLLDDYRMHPVIGNFVSETFYSDVNLAPRRTPEERAHRLGIYADSPVAWIDVPALRGVESGPPAYSKSRLAEIAVVKEEVSRILQTNSEFTLGVITFYEQQATRLKAELNALPMDLRTRLQVGTVDAFQGREFDVVFMSTVRSNNQRGDLRQRVGFLNSPNRLCVAFSRAKRLLVVVGDSDTIAGTQDRPAISEFMQFLKLCKDRGWYEQR